MRFIRYLIAALGCLFWMLPLAGAVARVKTYGFHQDGVWLLAIPAAMIVLTVGIGFVPPAHRAFGATLAAGTIAAFLAAFFWLAVWGASV